MIEIEKPDEARLQEVLQWPVWEKENSEFDWDYTEKEVFYILDGAARLTSDCGQDKTLQAGDLVTVEQGIQVRWQITVPIRKHYKFYS